MRALVLALLLLPAPPALAQREVSEDCERCDTWLAGSDEARWTAAMDTLRALLSDDEHPEDRPPATAVLARHLHHGSARVRADATALLAEHGRGEECVPELLAEVERIVEAAKLIGESADDAFRDAGLAELARGEELSPAALFAALCAHERAAYLALEGNDGAVPIPREPAPEDRVAQGEFRRAVAAALEAREEHERAHDKDAHRKNRQGRRRLAQVLDLHAAVEDAVESLERLPVVVSLLARLPDREIDRDLASAAMALLGTAPSHGALLAEVVLERKSRRAVGTVARAFKSKGSPRRETPERLGPIRIGCDVGRDGWRGYLHRAFLKLAKDLPPATEGTEEARPPVPVFGEGVHREWSTWIGEVEELLPVEAVPVERPPRWS